MGGDLNLKKSWHPHLKKNQERVWKEETRALAERKQIEKLQKEREEERDLENLRKLQEANGGKVAQKRVDWMYSGPSGDGAGVTEEREGYLLGKRRIDHLLKASDATTSLAKGAAAPIEAVASGNAGSARDIQSKISQDPLLAIQKQQMEIQMKTIKAAQKAKGEKERRHRHRRSRSPQRESNRYRSRSLQRESNRYRSRSPRRDSYYHRSRSPRRRDSNRHRSRSPRRASNRHRSRSPHQRNSRYERDYHKRSPSPYRRKDRDDDHKYRTRYQQSSEDVSSKLPTESAADKLAKMQAEAQSLEEQRKDRVRQREAQDAAEEEKHRKNIDGGHRFVSGMRNKAAEGLDLGDVIARGRAGFTKAVDV